MQSICEYLRMEEVKLRPGPEYMEKLQNNIDPEMRSVLIDWLVEVAEEFILTANSLYLTVWYIDRFLSRNIVKRGRLQLLGVTCMFIAAKREEMHAPEVENFCLTTDSTYFREDVFDMEKRVLSSLDSILTTPTIEVFLKRFIKASQGGGVELQLELEFLADFLAELTLLEYNFLRYLPSMVAASAVFLARLTLYGDADVWPSFLQQYTGYRASDLKDCVKGIFDLHCNSGNSTLPAIRLKYSQRRLNSVANILPILEVPTHCFEEET